MEIFDRPMPSDDAYRTSDIVYRRSLDDTVDLREVLAKLWIAKAPSFLPPSSSVPVSLYRSQS